MKRRVHCCLLMLLASFEVLAAAPACHDPLFVDQIAESAWTNIDVAPAEGTRGIRQAFAQARELATVPVRIRLAPGLYADNLGAEVFVQRLQRTAATPVYLVASDSRPNATQLGQGLNLLGVAFVAIDGVTIGPREVGAWDGRRHADPQPLQAAAGVHIAGEAIDARRSAVVGGVLDYSIYGRYLPSHHLVVRRTTIQNLFETNEKDAETSEGQSLDGMKFNQVQDLWVLDNGVRQTSRHGIDNVGVHRAAFCRNVISHTGGGQGIEAKGGATDILFDSNTFYRVRRVELGGENTDASYYFSADGLWNYEASRLIARNNLIIDAREAALEFSGCSDCTAINNSILFTAAYVVPSAGGTVNGGDAIRVHDSVVLGAAEGAGSDCQWWDPAQSDYVTVNPCWGVGSTAPAPVGKPLQSARLTVVNNLFASAAGSFGKVIGSSSTLPCPLNVIDGQASLAMNGNYWWNGNAGLPASGCSNLPEGSASTVPAAAPFAAAPVALGDIDGRSLAATGSSAINALLPLPGSPLAGKAVSSAATAAYDRLGAASATTIGAVAAGPNTQADRLFNWAERSYLGLFGKPDGPSAVLADYYYRHYGQTGAYLAVANGHAYYLGSASGGQVLDLGELARWMPAVLADGY
ncbi:right-handed parallel beta-helix repeat-containing protein [Chitinimonas sp.]|uniref:right-handed parallel beta-helix repeat-containing protein n=1 Tax=Chitinimonas sp. TaxID=1934313 RepID=UPI0035B29D60